MKLKLPFRLLGTLILAIFIGIGCFQDVPLSVQQQLLINLSLIAPVIFGILGVWVAVLDPTVILGQKVSEDITPRTRLALDFAPLLIEATFIFVMVIIALFVGPLLPEGWFVTAWSRLVLGSIISFLYIAETSILLRTLFPVAEALHKARVDLIKRDYRK